MKSEEINWIYFEATFMTELDGCNRIVKFKKLIEQKTMIYLFMEYLPNGDFVTFVESTKNHRLTETDTRKYFVQIIEGVEYAHKKNIIHRDIKLENIILNEDNEAVIVDWGFGAYWYYGKKLNTPCGTLLYACPEILSGGDYTGPEIDIYSLGVVLFAMATGCFPYVDVDEEKSVKKILQGNLEIPNYISKEMADLIASMLAVNPLHRISLNEVFNHPWIKKDPFFQIKLRKSIILTPRRSTSTKIPVIEALPVDIKPEIWKQVKRKEKKFYIARMMDKVSSKLTLAIKGKRGGHSKRAPTPTTSEPITRTKSTQKHARWSLTSLGI